MKKIILITCFLTICILAIVSSFNSTNASTSLPPDAHAGAPMDASGNTCVACHGGVATSTTGIISSDIPGTGFVGGTVYNFTVSMSGSSAYGYEITPQTASSSSGVGTLIGVLGSSISGKYVKHTTKIIGSSATWNFQWVAPLTGTVVTFYGGFNYANNNSSTSGDIIKTSSATYFSNSVLCPTPTITSISNNAPICSGSNLTLNVAAITSTGSLTYTWTGNGSFNSTSVSNPTVTGATSGNYTVNISNGCSSTSSVIAIVINPNPTVMVNSASICSGGNATLTASGASTYSWSPGATLSSTTNTIVTANPLSTTIYTIEGTTGICKGTSTTTVAIISTPTITVNSATVCNGFFATLTANGASTYTWTSPLTTSNPISVNPSSTTIYTVVGNASGCPGTFSATGTVLVNPSPSLTVTSTSSLICIGQSVALTASGASSYTWTNPGVTNGVAFSPTITTNYTVTGTQGPCSNTSNIIVIVNACAGIEDLTNSFYTSIYPNPNNGLFIIRTSILPASLIIYDLTGKEIMNKNLTEMETQINVPELENGVYYMNIKNGKNSINNKLIILK